MIFSLYLDYICSSSVLIWPKFSYPIVPEDDNVLKPLYSYILTTRRSLLFSRSPTSSHCQWCQWLGFALLPLRFLYHWPATYDYFTYTHIRQYWSFSRCLCVLAVCCCCALNLNFNLEFQVLQKEKQGGRHCGNDTSKCNNRYVTSSFLSGRRMMMVR